MTYIQAVAPTGSDPIVRNYGSGADGAVSVSGGGTVNTSAYGAVDGNGVRVINATTFGIVAGTTLVVNDPVVVVRASTSVDLQGPISGSATAASTYNTGAARGALGSNTISHAGGGGGGGHGTAGSDGEQSGGGPNTNNSGKGGAVRSTMMLFFVTNDTGRIGLPGGGGWGGDYGDGGGPTDGALGGNSGPIIIFIAPTITLGAGCLISLPGYVGANPAVTGHQGGGGGGAGGGVGLLGEVIMFPGSGTSIDLPGAVGGGTISNGLGGTGGNGLVVISYKTSITVGYASRITNAVVEAVQA